MGWQVGGGGGKQNVGQGGQSSLPMDFTWKWQSVYIRIYYIATYVIVGVKLSVFQISETGSKKIEKLAQYLWASFLQFNCYCCSTLPKGTMTSGWHTLKNMYYGRSWSKITAILYGH